MPPRCISVQTSDCSCGLMFVRSFCRTTWGNLHTQIWNPNFVRHSNKEATNVTKGLATKLSERTLPSGARLASLVTRDAGHWTPPDAEKGRKAPRLHRKSSKKGIDRKRAARRHIVTDADSALAEYIPMVQRPRGNTGKICIYIYITQ